MGLATTTDRKGLKILPVPNLSVPLLLLSSHSRTESLLPSMQSSINFMYIFPYGLYPVLIKIQHVAMLLAAGMQFLPELPELKPCHSPPEFQACPGLVVPLRTSAPEGERRGMGGDLQ